MPQKCYYKPNRSTPRRWSARAAARAVCAAREAGYTAQELRLEFAECVPCTENRRKQQQQQVALAALEQSQRTFAIADAALGSLELVSRIVGRLARFLPATGPSSLALLAVERSVGIVRAEIRVARAANDAAIAAVRLAA